MNDLRTALIAAGKITVEQSEPPRPRSSSEHYRCPSPNCGLGTTVPYAFCDRCAPPAKGAR